jgi:hypothetical protein
MLFAWGVVAALTGFVWNDWRFNGNRVLLGLAEAGLYPGILSATIPAEGPSEGRNPWAACMIVRKMRSP